jgi:hypothetical protein
MVGQWFLEVGPWPTAQWLCMLRRMCLELAQGCRRRHPAAPAAIQG